ncbi:MAG: sulfotransferase family protein [Marinosulfonomonas sp.]|nr:sulfotransferase family protein [Marinosulfonomonas sp.]
MPILRSGAQLIYYAHVPKCAGTAVEEYLTARFGTLAFHNKRYLSQPQPERWCRSSPQHIDLNSLNRLFPDDFFDFSFAVVRHPVDRIVSAWHFQLEVERTVPQGLTFGEWLHDLEDIHTDQPFAFDNHTRPMNDIVPQGAKTFHLEHGLEPIVPWLDEVTGEKAGPRAIGETNRRGGKAAPGSGKISPSPTEIAQIAQLYSVDFERFGYQPDKKEPLGKKNTANNSPKPEGQKQGWLAGLFGRATLGPKRSTGR